jgi:hypothetical protein
MPSLPTASRQRLADCVAALGELDIAPHMEHCPGCSRFLFELQPVGLCSVCTRTALDLIYEIFDGAGEPMGLYAVTSEIADLWPEIERPDGLAAWYLTDANRFYKPDPSVEAYEPCPF